MDSKFWDGRYAEAGYTYGFEPNEFLVSWVSEFPSGPVLSLGEGEGRNAVFLAKRGHDVTAVDQSVVGLDKVRRLADENGVTVNVVQADLAEFSIEPASWSAIISIFCHLPSSIRVPLHAAVTSGLVERGLFLIESFTPDQVGRDTGGPSNRDMLVCLEQLKLELSPLEIVQGCELERNVRSSALRSGGLASVVQAVARKRAADD